MGMITCDHCGAKYEEETSTAYYRQKSYEYLLDNYGVTKEETDQLIEDAGGFNDEYDRLKQIQENMQKLVLEKLM